MSLTVINDLCRIPEHWFFAAMNLPADVLKHILEEFCGYTNRHGVYMPKLRALPTFNFGRIVYVRDDDMYLLQLSRKNFRNTEVVTYGIVSQVQNYAGIISYDESCWGMAPDYEEIGAEIYYYNETDNSYEYSQYENSELYEAFQRVRNERLLEGVTGYKM